MAYPANCSFAPHRQSPTISDSPLLPLCTLLHVATSMPVMGNKTLSGLPGYPDFFAMRERRARGQMTLGELQRSRGVPPRDNPHAEMLEAYGYRQLAALVMDLPSMGLSAVNAVGRAMSFRIGPPGADAAPVGGADDEMTASELHQKPGITAEAVPKERHGETLWEHGSRQVSSAMAGMLDAAASFLRGMDSLLPSLWGSTHKIPALLSLHFSNDFEIWTSPSVQQAGNLRGVLIVFGEIHNDREVLRTIGLAMHMLIGGQREARAFIEGAGENICTGRLASFSLDLKHCDALEEGSKHYKQLIALRTKEMRAAKACTELVCKELGLDVEKQGLSTVYTGDHSAFVNRHSAFLPDVARRRLNLLIKEYNILNIEVEGIIDSLQPMRDQWMANGLRRGRTLEGVNIAMVGAAHLNGLREHLSDLPCVFMVPRAVVAQAPQFGLETVSGNTRSDEL